MDPLTPEEDHARTDFIVLCAQWLLLKLGGQVSFNIDEIQALTTEYAGTRMAFNKETGDVTLTLRTVAPQNEQAISRQSQAHTP